MSNGSAITPTPAPGSSVPVSTPAAPPHPFDSQWRVHIGDQTYGPFTGHQIKEYVAEGRVHPNTQILPVGSEAWIKAADDPHLSSIFRDSTKIAPPPITAAAGATVVQITNQVAQPSLLAGLELVNSKSPGMALILSMFICGVGQMYNGQVGKGILMLLGCAVLWLVFLGWVIWIWSMVDAYQTAKRMNLLHARQVAAGLSI